MSARPAHTFWHLADTVDKILKHYDERGMGRRAMVGNSRVLLTAGSETTATLLSGATYYLLQNPDFLHRVQSELRTAFGKEEEITLRSVSTPSLLPHLEATIHESFRCYPSIPATLPRRTGPDGAVVDGRFVPGNVRSLLLINSTRQSHLFRPPLASINGPHTTVAPTLLSPTNSAQSDGFRTRLPNFMATTRQHCSHFLWVLEAVSGRGELFFPYFIHTR